MFEFIRIESLLNESILNRNKLQEFSSYKFEIYFKYMHYLNRPLIFTSRLRYRLSSFLSEIRWVVSNVFVSRMDTQNKSKARLAPESLRYDINMLCAEPTVFYILKIQPCIYVIPKSI